MTVFTKRRLVTAAAFVVGVALGTPLAWGFEPPDIFELDGNAVQNNTPSPLGPDDWANILVSMSKSTVDPSIAKLVTTTQGSGITFVSGWPGVLQDPSPNTIAFGGGTKDVLDLQTGPWKWNNGSSPAKNDITNAYAAAYTLQQDIANTGNKNGDLVIFFGLDRKANNGDADLGFWFFQQTIGLQPNPPAGFIGQHTVGDILVLMNFPQGSPSSPNVHVLEWVGTGGEISGTLHELTAQLVGTGGACNPNSDQVACGLTNAGLTAITAPWPYTPKSGAAGTFPQESFFEGVLNISRVFRDVLHLPLPCLTSMIAETRSSESPTSSLQDFVLGSFQICGMDITKSCTAGKVNDAQTGFTWTFSGTVHNTGGASLHDVTVFDTPIGGSKTQIASLGTIAGGDTVSYGPFTYETIGASPNPASDTVEVTVAGIDGGPVILDKTADATCPQVTVSPVLSVDKICAGLAPDNVTPLGAFIDVAGGELVVKATIQAHVCNKGDIDLINLKVVDDDGGGTNTPVTLASNASLAHKTCVDYVQTFIPNGSGITLPAKASTITLHDTVTATATAVLGFGNVGPVTSTATCPLCQ